MRIVDLKGIGIQVLDISPGITATVDGNPGTAVISSEQKIDIADMELPEGSLFRFLVPYWSSQIQVALEVQHEVVEARTIYSNDGNQRGTEFVSHHGDQSEMSLMGLKYMITAD